MNALRSAFCLLLLLAATRPLTAQGTYTQIDYPGATTTWALGINSAGDIVGLYYDSSQNAHGFLLSGGVFTSIDYPGGPSYLVGINDLGQAVGTDFQFPFIYDISSQTFQLIQYPVAPVSPAAINNSGMVVGWLETNNAQQFGFIYTPGPSTRLISTPDAVTTTLTTLDGQGNLIGFSTTAGTSTSFPFSYSHGKYTKIKLDFGGNPLVNGINNAGTEIVGTYSPNNSASGFVFNVQTKALQPLRFAHEATIPNGVNDAGEVVATFYDASTATYHGFTWTPGSTPNP